MERIRMRFPREVWRGSHRKGATQFPREIKRSKKAYLDWVNLYNSRLNCYTTVYDFARFTDNTKIDNSVILDRMFLDFDAHDEPLEMAWRDFDKVVTKFLEENIKFRPYFSGQGFHIIVYGETLTEPHEIRRIQRFYRDLAEDCPTLDRTGIQTTRLRRIPNTENMKVGLFCIPLDIYEIGMKQMPPWDAVLQTAEKQVFEDHVFGKKLIKWPEVKSVKVSETEIELPEAIAEVPILPCLQNAITVENPSHYARVYLVQWYRDLLSGGERSIPLDKQDEITEMIMTELETIADRDGIWQDWDERKTRHYVEGIVRKGYHSPGCESVLIPQGYCIGKCWRYPDDAEI
jgi:hypothetical protein